LTIDHWHEYFASDAYLSFWLQETCTNDKLAPDCSTIKTYNDLFPLLSREKLENLAQEIDIHYKDDTGTVDNKYGPYKTLLPFPQLLDPNKIDWKAYFDKIDVIIPKFCKNINELRSPGEDVFFADLTTKYEPECEEKNGEYPLKKNFHDENDKAFRDWIFDAFMPTIKYFPLRLWLLEIAELRFFLIS
jgi:hypothetical protein